MIYSIGYGNRGIGEFIQLLQTHDIEYLIDVRSQPYSRFYPDYSKQTLEAHLTEANIRYVFMGDELGGRPEDKSCYTDDGRVDYQKVKEKSFYQEGIQRLVKANEGEHRVVMMCSEMKPETCHRSKLIGESLRDIEIEVIHIREDGTLKKQHELIVRQRNLFGGYEQFTSDERYLEHDESDDEA